MFRLDLLKVNWDEADNPKAISELNIVSVTSVLSNIPILNSSTNIN